MCPKTLLYLAQIEIYHQLYSILNFIRSNGYYCFCDWVPGCSNEDELVDCCLICIIINERKYNQEKLDEIKKLPIKLVNFARALFLDLQEIFDFDETINYGWENMFFQVEIVIRDKGAYH